MTETEDKRRGRQSVFIPGWEVDTSHHWHRDHSQYLAAALSSQSSVFGSWLARRALISVLLRRSWSDWVSCLHAKVGVPRWLTAATISLGIIFSIWLCLVIPSTAPKRKVKTLLIKGEKPSAAILKAVKEAEAAAAAKAKEAEASGLKKQDYMVAVINVDLPPTYGDVAVPGSPAPSYKSDMAAVPASPAPSYKSMDVAGGLE